MKKLNFRHLCLAVWLGMASLSCAQNKATFEIKEDEKLIEFTTDRFTLPNLHVTPDGESIIFDVLGDIYQVPIDGGKAEVLLQDNNWKRGAKLSPDGKVIAYVSDETGVFQVWTHRLDTKERRVYPIIESQHFPLYPYWGKNNELFIPSEEGIREYDVESGKEKITRLAKKEELSILQVVNRTISVGTNGTHAYFQKEGAFWVYDFNKKIDLFIGNTPEGKMLYHFKISPNGKNVLYYNEIEGNFLKQELKAWNIDTNKIKKLNENDKVEPSTTLNYSLDFIDDRTIVLDKEGQFVRMDLETGKYDPIPIEVDVKKVIKKPLRRLSKYIKDSIITASVLRNPVTRPGLDTIYFGAFGKLHSYAKNAEQIIELYPKEDRFEIAPSLSPDGKHLAYTTWNDVEMGHLFVRELETGKEYQITKKPGRYINPEWSPDGTEIVFVSDETEAKLGIPMQTPGAKTSRYSLDIYSVSLESFKVQEIEKPVYLKRISPMTNTPRRFYPIPVYHPNGESIFITSRNRNKDLPILMQIDLITKEVLSEELIPFHTEEVLISPNTKHIAFILDEQVWIDKYPYSNKLEFYKFSEFIAERHHYNGGFITNLILPNAKSIYEIAPSYLSWQDENTLMWGSAEEVYTYDIRTGKTNKITAIKVERLRAIPKTQYALTNTRIITMNKEDRIIEKGTILIKDNRIEKVGRVDEIDIPKQYKVFDLKGKTIIPGLIDVHAHYHHFPHEFQVQQNYKYVGNLAYGVTTIYDPSVNVLDYRERAQMVEIGKLLGPRVFASGNIIMSGKKEYDYKTIESLEDADRLLQSFKKLKVSGPIKEYEIYNSLKRNFLREASFKSNLGITAHQESFINAINRVINGYSAIEHEISGFKLNKDIESIIALSKVNYTPTFMVSPRIGDLYLDRTIKEKEKLLRFNGEILYQNNYAQYSFDLDSIKQSSRDLDLINRSIDIKRASSTIRDIVKLGGIVSVGGHGNPLPGIGTHIELWSFTFDGLPAYNALKAATINGAKKLSLQDEIGSLEEGKLADIVVLNSNPLNDIFNSTDILYTIQNGNIYEAETMKQVFPREKELRPWGRDSPTVIESMQSIYISN